MANLRRRTEMVRSTLHRLVLASLLAAAFALPVAAQAKPDPAKVALIREMLDLTQVVEQSLSVMKRMSESQRAANPNIPAVFWDRFLLRARERSGELLDLLIPVYQEAFTADDLRGLIAFYRTPVGARFLAAQPGLTQAGMEAGERWGMRLGQDVAQELEKEGVRLQ
jgi:uncharacterized protein